MSKKYKITANKPEYIISIGWEYPFGLVKRVFYKASGIMREYCITDGKWDIISSTNIMYDIIPFFPNCKLD